MDLREIINFDYTNDRISLNMEVMLMLDELRELYYLRRKKPLAKQPKTDEGGLFEFKMIWWIANPAAPGFKMGLPTKVLLDKAKHEFAPVGWRYTTVFEDALDKYIELMVDINPIYSLLKSHTIAITTATKSIEIMTSSLSEYVSTFKVDITNDASVKVLDNVQSILKALLSDGEKLNERIKSYKLITEAYGKEEVKIKKIRGDKQYLPSMDADNDVER